MHANHPTPNIRYATKRPSKKSVIEPAVSSKPTGEYEPVNVLQDVKIAIQRLDYPMDRNVFEQWKQSTLSILESATGNGSDPALHSRLSPRETEVMSMLLQGRRLKEIAAQLEISVKTVTTHRARLLRKLRLEDNLGLYRYGIRHGLISV